MAEPGNRPDAPVPLLPARWSARWDRMREWLGLGMVFIPTGERLLARYSEPGRHYHDARHLLACLRAFDDFPGSIRDPDAVELALWFHDAVYDPLAPPGKNEERSVRLFRSEFEAMAGDRVDMGEVERLILATGHRLEPEDGDCALIADIDLGILGADPPRYAAYTEEIRREYAGVPDEAYREGRARVLRGFLARGSIYRTRHFQAMLGERARANLEGELDALLLPWKG